MKKYIWIFIVGAPLFAVLMAGVRVYYLIDMWSYQGKPVVFTVNPGEGFSKINGRLSNQGLISNAKVFHRYCQINGLMTKFQAGQYQIEYGFRMTDVIETLTKGKSITTDITIPEGKNLYEIAAILKEGGVIDNADEFVQLSKDPLFTKELGIRGKTVEGYLYPETYKFTPNSSAKTVIKGMVDLFESKIKDLDFSRAPQGLSKDQVIILASIVEKETGAAFERPKIAGVFLNRLKKRMRLQSDPTTIYGIWENYNGNLRKRHLLERTPYNTYKISGLPAGPISNPGLESIKAVLNPEPHKYLYFVSMNDGTHVFSETLRQHNQAVQKYQKNWRNRRGKSWRDLDKKKSAY